MTKYDLSQIIQDYKLKKSINTNDFEDKSISYTVY